MELHPSISSSLRQVQRQIHLFSGKDPAS
ncbi:unnamed protein product [Linum tenue]|uniref:Uncharacterized protein n=1 Tax=Linum tenue TaxID=586396 RepID=A0AAV0QYR0_9ROSI|nr:unnamed protein product [Linum tenue]